MIAMLMAGNPVSGILGGPISGYILHSMGGAQGVAGWQWLFLIEAVPAVMLGIIILFYLDNRVSEAKWLQRGREGDCRRRNQPGSRRQNPSYGALGVCQRRGCG